MVGRAIVPAGGRGSRLRPFTDIVPKTNVYINSKRILEYVVDNFVRAGFHNVTFAVEYMSKEIRNYFENGSHFIYEGKPLKIRYATADTGKQMAGDADAIRKSRFFIADKIVAKKIDNGGEELQISPEEYIDNKEKYELKSYIENFDHIVVSNCDVLTNIDFSKLIDFHKKSGAVATIALYDKIEKEKIAGNLGIVMANKSGVVQKFIEKPKYDSITTTNINTGIVVFDKEIYNYLERNPHIHLLGRQAFPDLLEKYPGSVMGLVMDGYWNDIGTIESYRNTQIKLIDGIPGIDTSSKKEGQQKISDIRGTVVHSSISPGCTIEDSARVEDSVLGEKSYVGPNSRLKNCILLPGSVIKGEIGCYGLIIDSGAEISEGAKIGKNVCIGSNVFVEPGAEIRDDIRIGPNEIIKKGQVVSEDILNDE